MRAVLGTLPLAPVPARLAGFVRRRLAGAVYPAVVASAGASTDGVVYRGLEPGHVERLDRFEGDLYERLEVRVEPRDGPPEEALVYVLRAAHRHLLTPEEWDPDEFSRRHLARYVRALGAPRARPAGAGA